MADASSTSLTTNVVDLASVSLHEIGSTRALLLEDAINQLTAAIRSGGNVESIQGQRD
jgi:hypothetical protein